MKRNHAISIVFSKETYKALFNKAAQEKRPVAQMARVLIERALEKEKG